VQKKRFKLWPLRATSALPQRRFEKVL
jgi:hypothetical protein